ncbi:MAG: hypothetical protein AAGU77_08555 [Bacillota bacterium]
MAHPRPIEARFPPSEPCSCAVCTAYCLRPGWWTVRQAQAAFDAELGGRMMLETSPEHRFGVLSPALRGCEGSLAPRPFPRSGCCFFRRGLCELFGTGFEPLECRFCHHARPGLGAACHAAIEADWNTPAGQALVIRWLCAIAQSPLAAASPTLTLPR